MHLAGNKKGLALVFVMIVLVALLGVTLAFWYMANSGLIAATAELQGAQAFYIAEAGRAKARYYLAVLNQSLTETATPFGANEGTYVVSTTSINNPPVTITSDGYIPYYPTANSVYRARRRVTESGITVGGGNLSLASSGTIISSSGDQGGNPASQANDGLTNTGWISSNKQNSWLQVNYGSQKTVGRVVISGSKITSIVVQYSNDGANWTNVSNPSGALPGTRTFTPVTAQYLKLVITSGANEKAQVDEFESYSGAGGGSLGKGPIRTSF